METNVNYTIVGAFVIALLCAIIMTIIWLSAGFTLYQYTTYKVYMKESVSGLNIDGPVEYNGVNVGTVKSIELDPINPQLVELLLSVKSETPITQGTKATLNTRGFTGITYVALQDKGLDRKPLLPARGQQYAVINTAPSLFLRWDTALNKLTENFQQVANSITTLLNDQNQQSIRQTLLNLRKFTDTLSNNTKQINDILQNTAKASQELGPLLKSSRDTVDLFESQTMTNMNNLTHNLLDLSNEIKQNPAMLIRGKQQPPLGPGER